MVKSEADIALNIGRPLYKASQAIHSPRSDKKRKQPRGRGRSIEEG